jgi:hypothetical protein
LGREVVVSVLLVRNAGAATFIASGWRVVRVEAGVKVVAVKVVAVEVNRDGAMEAFRTLVEQIRTDPPS